MKKISQHTSYLARRLYFGMTNLYHSNGHPVCVIHNETDGDQPYDDSTTQGSTIAFSIVRSDGSYVGHSLVEKLANDEGMFIRAGGLCNPGGISRYLKVEPWQFKRAWSAGHRCGEGSLEIINGLPTGVVRASLGAMSTLRDVDTFLEFLAVTFESRAGVINGIDHSDYEFANGLGRADSGFHSRNGSSTASPIVRPVMKHISSTSNLPRPQTAPRRLHPQQSYYGKVGRHDMGRTAQGIPDVGINARSQLYALDRRPYTGTSRDPPPGPLRFSSEVMTREAFRGLDVEEQNFDDEKKTRTGKFKFWKAKRSVSIAATE